MSIERMGLAIAGSFILVSIAFSLSFSPYGLLFTPFVGANLLQSAFTGFCPLAKIFKGSAQNRTVKPLSVRRLKDKLLGIHSFFPQAHWGVNGVKLLFLFAKHSISALRALSSALIFPDAGRFLYHRPQPPPALSEPGRKIDLSSKEGRSRLAGACPGKRQCESPPPRNVRIIDKKASADTNQVRHF